MSKIKPEQIYGNWIVLEQIKSKDNKNSWFTCLCKLCNQKKDVIGYTLLNGKSKSCGCDKSFEKMSKKNKELGIKNRDIIRKLLKKGYSQRDILANLITSQRLITEERRNLKMSK